MDAAQNFLAQLAERSAATWHALGARTFPGTTTVETANRVYSFRDGVFVSRAAKPTRSSEAPRAMRGLRLIGFLADEGGFWSLSPRWRAGAHAVLWKPPASADERIDPKSFILTSPTSACSTEDPRPEPWVAARAASESGVRIRHIARPPSIVRPAPASMTRIHAGAVAAASLP